MLTTFIGIESLVKIAMEDALRKILTPTDSLDLLLPGIASVNIWKCVCAALILVLNALPLKWLSYTSVIGIFSTFCSEFLCCRFHSTIPVPILTNPFTLQLCASSSSTG